MQYSLICTPLYFRYCSCLFKFSSSHSCWGHYSTVCLWCGSQVQKFPAGSGGLSLHDCRRDVLLDLCCDLFAPGLNIWLSPQAPSSCLGLYVGLSIENWNPVTLQGPARTVGLVSWLIHKDTYQDMLLLWFRNGKAKNVIHTQSWQYQPPLYEIA